MNKKLSLVVLLAIVGVLSIGSVLARNLSEVDDFARDAAINYILSNHEEMKDLQTLSSWATQTLTPWGVVRIVHVTTCRRRLDSNRQPPGHTISHIQCRDRVKL